MTANSSQMLLVEAAMLITATRLRIARSAALLAEVTLDGARSPTVEAPVHTLGPRASQPPRATSV